MDAGKYLSTHGPDECCIHAAHEVVGLGMYLAVDGGGGHSHKAEARPRPKDS